MLAVPLLVVGLGLPAMAQDAGRAGNAPAGADPGCRPPPPAGTVDRAGKDPQPTRAEIVERLDQSGCAQGSVDASEAAGKQVDELYEQLMQATAPTPPAAGGAGGGQ
jgi:hypothetical protein